MSKSDRNNPRRSTASESRYSLIEFEREFPDDAACLDWLFRYRYPDGVVCPTEGRVTKHHREKSRPSYSCQFCGHRVHPMVGTIFEDSATSLKLWFYAMYLMASTRCGISAKQLERELGVTYKTAWRMANRIRTLMFQDDEPLSGTVEADEAYMGGAGKWKHKGQRPVSGRPDPKRRPPVLGMVQRKTAEAPAKIAAVMVEDTSRASLLPQVSRRVLPASTVYTDEWHAYKDLPRMGYGHERINHMQEVYVSGDVHTQTIEGFWSLVKRGISGVYHGVSTKHLQSYLDEYVFRYNNRTITGRRGMFDAFLTRIPRALE